LLRMRAGEFDVIDAIVETPERREYFDFTPAYTPIEASVFFRDDISAITDIGSLKGFPVGVKAGDQHVDKLKANGVTTVVSFPNYDAMIDAAKQHKINVFVIDNPSALYLLNKAGIEDEFRHSAPMFRDELRRAVRKGDTALLRTVSEGFAAIEPDELKQINEKWFGRAINRIGQYLAYAGYAVSAALLIIAGLTAWNRILRKKVLQRTAALGESEQRFRRLVELMPVAVYVCDTEGRIQTYNDRAVELWGREPEPGNTAQRYCGSLRLYSSDGKLVPHEESKMAEVLRTGVPAHDLEVVIERPDGSFITVSVNIAPLRNGKGELVGAMNCFQDITERKRVVLALDERLSFETLLTELSAAFASLPTTTVDREIDKWLQNLVEFLDLDRATFDQMGDRGTLLRSHAHTAPGIDPAQLNVTNDQTPWITEQVLLGNTIKWSRIPDDIPEQASKEREFAARIGAKSVLSIPVWIGGSVICAISFTSMRTYREWPDEMVARLRLVGEIFANAIARKRAAKELEEANHQLRFLSRRLFEIQEEERRHLARELHDEVGQALTAAKINLRAAIEESDAAKSKRIHETSAILEQLLGQVRQISLDLRPSTLDDLGLVPALRSLLDQQGRRASVAVRFSARKVPKNLDPEIQTTCFRIAQEAITNAVRHANATRIDVDLGQENGNLRIQVRDNGRGFDAESVRAQTVGLGLIGIKERAALVDARAKIISSPNEGTTVEVSLPITLSPERESRETGK
jgi:two-component system, NarL family, sensor kinase